MQPGADGKGREIARAGAAERDRAGRIASVNGSDCGSTRVRLGVGCGIGRGSDAADASNMTNPLRFLTSMGRPVPAGATCAASGPKGREASAPAVPPFLRATGNPRRRASLGCSFRGNHPPEPTCRARRRSSASRSEARSGRIRESQASTVPESLARLSALLLPIVAGDHQAHIACCVPVIDRWLLHLSCSQQCADRSAEWRPSARRTGPTRWPPERRAGGSLPLPPMQFRHRAISSDSSCRRRSRCAATF